MEFVTFEIAKKLKEKGFNHGCLSYYGVSGALCPNSIDICNIQSQELDYRDFLNRFNESNSIGLIDAPTISQALKWLREKDIIITITYTKCLMYKIGSQMMFGFNVQNIQGDLLAENTEVAYGSYEQAVLDSIECALNHLI